VIVSLVTEDPDACTRFAVTVARAAITPRSVAHTVAEVVARCVGPSRHDDVVLAVHDVLTDAFTRDVSEPFTVRVRERPDRTEVEVTDHGGATQAHTPGRLYVAEACCDELHDEVTDAGHVVRLVYRSA
jgi:anti-sigma regulatory factor (Ser/Thr protein kinase)